MSTIPKNSTIQGVVEDSKGRRVKLEVILSQEAQDLIATYPDAVDAVRRLEFEGVRKRLEDQGISADVDWEAQNDTDRVLIFVSVQDYKLRDFPASVLLPYLGDWDRARTAYLKRQVLHPFTSYGIFTATGGTRISRGNYLKSAIAQRLAAKLGGIEEHDEIREVYTDPDMAFVIVFNFNNLFKNSGMRPPKAKAVRIRKRQKAELRAVASTGTTQERQIVGKGRQKKKQRTDHRKSPANSIPQDAAQTTPPGAPKATLPSGDMQPKTSDSSVLAEAVRGIDANSNQVTIREVEKGENAGANADGHPLAPSTPGRDSLEKAQEGTNMEVETRRLLSDTIDSRKKAFGIEVMPAGDVRVCSLSSLSSLSPLPAAIRNGTGGIRTRSTSAPPHVNRFPSIF